MTLKEEEISTIQKEEEEKQMETKSSTNCGMCMRKDVSFTNCLAKSKTTAKSAHINRCTHDELYMINGTKK